MPFFAGQTSCTMRSPFVIYHRRGGDGSLVLFPFSKIVSREYIRNTTFFRRTWASIRFIVGILSHPGYRSFDSSVFFVCTYIHCRIDNHHNCKCQSPNASLSNVVQQGGKHDIAKSNTYVHILVSLVSASLVPRWQTSQEIVATAVIIAIVQVCPALTERSSLARALSPPRLSTRPLLAPFVVRSLRGPLFVSLRLCREHLWKLEVREKERERERQRERSEQDFFFFILRPFQRARSRRNGRGPYFVTR